MARKKNRAELNNLLEKVVTKISTDFDIDEILLYGSYAKGKAHEWSDVDVAVISPELNLKYPITALPSEKYYQETFIDPGFIREIKNTGKQIYTKEKGADFSCLDELGLD